jgi:hypothetical protein
MNPYNRIQKLKHRDQKLLPEDAGPNRGTGTVAGETRSICQRHRLQALLRLTETAKEGI